MAEATAVCGAEPYPLQSASCTSRPWEDPTAPSFMLTGFRGQQCGFPQTRASFLMPGATSSLSRKIPAGYINCFLSSHQWNQDRAVPNHIFCVFSCIPHESRFPSGSALGTERFSEKFLRSYFFTSNPPLPERSSFTNAFPIRPNVGSQGLWVSSLGGGVSFLSILHATLSQLSWTRRNP